MRKMLVLALVLGLVGVAAANDLGNQAPVKSPVSYPENIPNPLLQGGDTFALATVIPSVPYNDSGTTIGYTNDYDAVCPYTGSTAPDVVYVYTATATGTFDIDLCGSYFDTKLYVMDAAQTVLACNDDFYPGGTPCGDFVSFIGNFLVTAGQTYYIVIDGYYAASGIYFLDISASPPPCDLGCPAGGFPEGEPALNDGYVDNYNGGCNTPPGYPFQNIQTVNSTSYILCGVSGWYYAPPQVRDTDWFILHNGAAGAIDVVGDAEYPTYIYELSPQDCATIGVLQVVILGPCALGFMTISGYAPGAPVWFWVGSTSTVGPPGADNEYDYVIWFSGLDGSIATESTTWGTVKALYE